MVICLIGVISLFNFFFFFFFFFFLNFFLNFQELLEREIEVVLMLKGCVD